MNILFLTMGRFSSIESHSIYADLLRCFRNNGNQVFVVAPENNGAMKRIDENGCSIIPVDIGDAIGSGNLIKKGIAQICIDGKYKTAIQKHLGDVKFDLILYSTPPITLYGVVKYVKHRDKAKTYLLLKDIFPQNAVDIGMMRTTGIKGLLYKYFRIKEKKLYSVSDKIGCMSQANVDYVIRHNPEVNPDKVEICPNCIEVRDMSVTDDERIAIRNKYNIPLDKRVFVYGGNLGRPQGIDFIIECLKKAKEHEKAFFLIVGNGTEYGKLESFVNSEELPNVKLMKSLPKEDYDCLVAACDVGMIFLDHRFTIPNFPSRLLSYMQARLPVFACTDTNTDIGKVITEGSFGWWCESNDIDAFNDVIEICVNDNLTISGKNAYDYLSKYYTVEGSYENIIDKFGMRDTVNR